MNTQEIELPPLPEGKYYDGLAMLCYGKDCVEADRKRRGEPVAWIVPDFGFLFPSKDAAERYLSNVGDARKPTPVYAAPQPAQPVGEVVVTKDEHGRIVAVTRQDHEGRILKVIAISEGPQPAEPENGEELLAARDALVDMGYLWDGDQWVEVDPPSKTAEQAPEWPDFARMEASLQRLKERLVFENGRRKDLEQRLREKRNG